MISTFSITILDLNDITDRKLTCKLMRHVNVTRDNMRGLAVLTFEA